MEIKLYSLTIAAGMAEVSEDEMTRFEAEGLIAPRMEGDERLYTDDDVEKIKMIKRLMDDLGVNLAGVEVILNMRSQMLDMQEEFEKIIDEMRRGILRELGEYQSRMNRPRIESKSGKTMKVRVE